MLPHGKTISTRQCLRKALACGFAVWLASPPATRAQAEPLPPPGEHPRIFFDAGEIPKIRERWDNSRHGRVARERIDQFRRDLPKWQGLASLPSDPPSPHDIAAWFTPDEQRNILWGVLALDAVLRDDAGQKAYMADVITNYARIILASKALAADPPERIRDTPLAKHLKVWSNDKFDVEVSRLFGAAGFPLAYDLLHGDMTPGQRDTIRAAIAAATAGRRPWGAGAPKGRAFSNWYGYHGELAVMLAAIEGEEGYDEETYRVIEQILKDYFEVGFTPEGACHEDSYGPNLGFRAGGLGYLVLARRGHNLTGTEKFRNIVRAVAQDAQPFAGGSLVGGASGTGLIFPSSIVFYRHVLPDEPAANYLYRLFLGDDQTGMKKIQSQLEFVLFGGDWKGKGSLSEMGEAMGLPLTFFSPRRGKLIARSDWSSGGTILHFDARPDAFAIGHDTADRGSISLIADGRTWTHLPSFHHTFNSADFSLVHVDGSGQPWKAPSVRFLAHADSDLAAGGAADLKYAYDWQWTPPWPKKDQQFPAPWEPEMSDPRTLGWPDNPAWLPNKLHGEDGIGHEGSHMWRRPYNPVQRAFRTVTLVRGQNPYVLVVDDVKKDDEERAYAWHLQLAPDVELERVEGRDIILREPGGDRRLLVRVIGADGFQGATVERYTISTDKRSQQPVEGNRLLVKARSVDPGFKVILYPFREGKPLPVSRWTEDDKQLEFTVGNTTDTIAFLGREDGRNGLRVQRGNQSWSLE
jgi:hypothetical protein